MWHPRAATAAIVIEVELPGLVRGGAIWSPAGRRRVAELREGAAGGRRREADLAFPSTGNDRRRLSYEGSSERTGEEGVSKGRCERQRRRCERGAGTVRGFHVVPEAGCCVRGERTILTKSLFFGKRCLRDERRSWSQTKDEDPQRTD
jgi:hypothetical protein